MLIASADERLRGQVKHNIRLLTFQYACQIVRIANVADEVLDFPRDSERFKKAGRRRHIQGKAGDNCSMPEQPKREPGALETGVPGDENAPTPKEMQVIHDAAFAHLAADLAPHGASSAAKCVLYPFCQTFHGDMPWDHKSSNSWCSRAVSMHCQK